MIPAIYTHTTLNEEIQRKQKFSVKQPPPQAVEVTSLNGLTTVLAIHAKYHTNTLSYCAVVDTDI